MPRLHYFDRLTADDDDLALGEAKVLGYVSTGCLLGGEIVWRWIALDADPCMQCLCDRARCGGREPEEPPAPETAVERLNRALGRSGPD